MWILLCIAQENHQIEKNQIKNSFHISRMPQLFYLKILIVDCKENKKKHLTQIIKFTRFLSDGRL